MSKTLFEIICITSIQFLLKTTKLLTSKGTLNTCDVRYGGDCIYI